MSAKSVSTELAEDTKKKSSEESLQIGFLWEKEEKTSPQSPSHWHFVLKEEERERDASVRARCFCFPFGVGSRGSV